MTKKKVKKVRRSAVWSAIEVLTADLERLSSCAHEVSALKRKVNELETSNKMNGLATAEAFRRMGALKTAMTEIL